ncbi:hypothetical protein [Brevundimonas naejangsanensis]|uniref:hypothetical protein n=1 Tax=Brevundimonas naejangsanensis TaxID=588932 RepID=UPI0039F71FE1
MLSSAALQRRRQEVLINAGTVYGLIIGANELAVQGRETDALKALATITGALSFEIDAIREILAAEREAAKARDLTQRTLAPFFPRVPVEEPHAANDEAQSPSPEQPSPTVA